MISELRRLALLPLLLACAGAARAAGETVAVLSSDSGAYLEAFSAFQAAFGSEVPYLDISHGNPVLPPGTGTVVVFGGKAASFQYPPEVAMIYCMAPGIFMRSGAPEGRSGKISLIPDFPVIFSRIKEIQPGIRRLRVFWMSPAFGAFKEAAMREGTRQGLEITGVKVPGPEDVPALLRVALGETDAFWLPPDPLMVTPENLMIMREFSWSNAIPFYGSTKGMTREGAAASIGVSFKDMGVAAARAAQRLAAGEKIPHMIFPETVEMTLNSGAARKCRLEFTPEILRQANYLFP